MRFQILDYINEKNLSRATTFFCSILNIFLASLYIIDSKVGRRNLVLQTDVVLQHYPGFILSFFRLIYFSYRSRVPDPNFYVSIKRLLLFSFSHLFLYYVQLDYFCVRCFVSASGVSDVVSIK